MKFLLEGNLYRLAKWLRFMGHDVKLLKKAISIGELMENGDRVFLTTSRRWEKTLKNLGIKYVVVPRHDWEAQLYVVIKALSLNPELKLNLCAYCGSELKPVSREMVRDKVPQKVYLSAYDFTTCPACGAVFWKGTHYERMVPMLKRVLTTPR